MSSENNTEFDKHIANLEALKIFLNEQYGKFAKSKLELGPTINYMGTGATFLITNLRDLKTRLNLLG